MKHYMLDNKLVGSSNYVYYDAGKEDGERLILAFRETVI